MEQSLLTVGCYGFLNQPRRTGATTLDLSWFLRRQISISSGRARAHSTRCGHDLANGIRVVAVGGDIRRDGVGEIVARHGRDAGPVRVVAHGHHYSDRG